MGAVVEGCARKAIPTANATVTLAASNSKIVVLTPVKSADPASEFDGSCTLPEVFYTFHQWLYQGA